MTYIRFTNNSPNIFETPDVHDFEKLCLDYFKPREKDNGKTSFYLYNQQKENFITSAYIVIKQSCPKNQRLIFINDSVFFDSQVEINYQKTNIFSCIESNHYCADFSDLEKLKIFILNLKDYLLNNKNTKVIKSYSKSQIKELLTKTKIECKNYEKELLAGWVSDFLET